MLSRSRSGDKTRFARSRGGRACHGAVPVVKVANKFPRLAVVNKIVGAARSKRAVSPAACAAAISDGLSARVVDVEGDARIRRSVCDGEIHKHARACNQLEARKGDSFADGSGRAGATDLYPGLYYVKELEAPAGYVRDETEYEVKLASDQEVDIHFLIGCKLYFIFRFIPHISCRSLQLFYIIETRI